MNKEYIILELIPTASTPDKGSIIQISDNNKLALIYSFLFYNCGFLYSNGTWLAFKMYWKGTILC